MKNRFIQHIPEFCDFQSKEFYFDTTEQLLENELISKWTKNPEFHKFSLENELLMCELQEGKKWYVLGSIKYPEKVNLPKWKAVK